MSLCIYLKRQKELQMRRSGFTLTELAVVIAMICIMICIIIGIGGCIKKVSNKGLKNVVSDIWNGQGGQE